MAINLLNFKRCLQLRSRRIIGRSRTSIFKLVVVNTLSRLVSNDGIAASLLRRTVPAIVLTYCKGNGELLKLRFAEVRNVVDLESGQIGLLVVPVFNLPTLRVGYMVRLAA